MSKPTNPTDETSIYKKFGHGVAFEPSIDLNKLKTSLQGSGSELASGDWEISNKGITRGGYPVCGFDTFKDKKGNEHVRAILPLHDDRVIQYWIKTIDRLNHSGMLKIGMPVDTETKQMTPEHPSKLKELKDKISETLTFSHHSPSAHPKSPKLSPRPKSEGPEIELEDVGKKPPKIH